MRALENPERLMLIGVPKEIKDQEHRVGLTPASVREIVAHGHEAMVETNAGAGIGATDADYTKAGARIAANAQEVFATAEMIVVRAFARKRNTTNAARIDPSTRCSFTAPIALPMNSD